jgi:hypothetical protein
MEKRAALASTLAEIRLIFLRQLAASMNPDLVEHAPEINVPPIFSAGCAPGTLSLPELLIAFSSAQPA